MTADEPIGVDEHATGYARRLAELLVSERAPLQRVSHASHVAAACAMQHLLGESLATFEGGWLDGHSLHAPADGGWRGLTGSFVQNKAREETNKQTHKQNFELYRAAALRCLWQEVHYARSCCWGA